MNSKMRIISPLLILSIINNIPPKIRGEDSKSFESFAFYMIYFRILQCQKFGLYLFYNDVNERSNLLSFAPILAKCIRQLDEYFDERRTCFDVSVHQKGANGYPNAKPSTKLNLKS